ncbi:MAG: hypothetical protein GY898_33430 [Proteobacteria bacterium]|nr:hypothetical protein [Pseudomonadota bacterium]
MSRSIAIAAALAALLTGCVNVEYSWLVVEVDGTVVAPEAGAITVEFHHLKQGEGALAHPLGWIDEIAIDGPGAFAHELTYPEHDGTGLAVYAWQDVDGDGVFCAPGADDELAGAESVLEFPAFEASVAITLSPACAGPERFFD